MLEGKKKKRRRKTVSKQKGSFTGPMARGDRIVMVKQQTPKKVMLPNGRTFYARCKWATRTDLPANVRLERPYKQRAAPRGRRCQVRQGGRCFKSAFGKLMRFAKKVGNNKAF